MSLPLINPSYFFLYFQSDHSSRFLLIMRLLLSMQCRRWCEVCMKKLHAPDTVSLQQELQKNMSEYQSSFFLEPALPSCPCPLLQHFFVIIFTSSFGSYQRNQKCGHTNAMCRAWIQSITTKQTYWISKASFKCTLNLKDSTVIVNYFWSENIVEATIIWRKILGSDLLGSLKDPLWWAAVVAGSSPWIQTQQQPQFCFGIYKPIFRVVLEILQIITGSE